MWSFSIDVGGTFTDCFAVKPDGRPVRYKLLSSGRIKGSVMAGSTGGMIVDLARQGDPAHIWTGYKLNLLAAGGRVHAQREVVQFDPATGSLWLNKPVADAPPIGQAYELLSHEEAPIVAIRYLMSLGLKDRIPPVNIRLGTTRGTNALITRSGACTALVTTRGFADLLRIGYQNRPHLFRLDIEQPQPLFNHVIEIDERIAAQGDVLRTPDRTEVQAQLRRLKQLGVDSIAICFLNAYRNPQHEQQVAAWSAEVGFEETSLSSEVAPLVKMVPRGDTTVLDAYLNPVLRSYINSLRESLAGESDLRLLTSAGGIVDVESFRGKDSILSGPAGGVVGYSRIAAAAGFDRAIGFDMGGTSTDVSRYDGQFDLQYETEKAGVRVVTPMMAIETIAAGGGSICRFDGVKLVVGPDSAGADPGPACYGKGGPITITDINFWLGKIIADRFPFPLAREAVEQGLQTLADSIRQSGGRDMTLVELATGFLQVANANMAKAIRSISLAKGYDPRDYVLVGFGGAAPQHACAVADELGMATILNHPDGGILSALGAGLADVVLHHTVGVYQTYTSDSLADVERKLSLMEATLRDDLQERMIANERITITRMLDLRYAGTDASLTVRDSSEESYHAAFSAAHQRLYGYTHDRPVEIVAARVEAAGRAAEPLPRSHRSPRFAAHPSSTTHVWFGPQRLETSLYNRMDLRAGAVVSGPAVVTEGVSTTVIDPNWQAEMLDAGELVITRHAIAAPLPEDSGKTSASAVAADPVLLEIFNNHFVAIAEQMGITLRNTSSSVNVKERLDYSCALFTPSGDLVVNAPHIPVHLGAMSETVRCLLADNPDMSAGDVFVTNDPYRGGSHLPDVTVVTPVYDPQRQRLFFTANRAHHAEIGGITPGSMPPFSTNLAEEGILIRNTKVVEAGTSRLDNLRELLSSGPWPSRAVDDNLADISAQIAANRQGAADLMQLVQRYGLETVQAYMGHIQNAAEHKTRTALRKLTDGRRVYRDHLDDGSAIGVSIEISGDQATIDFSGTDPVLASNLNANRAIVTAAVLYCLRCLIDEEIPLNEGVLAPVQIDLPQCLLNPPAHPDPAECAAVVGGNVETSQRVVDVILGALELAAASQGTMNNVLFGDRAFGYYETICGGAGATPDCAGADAVHTHMTNTRLTDPEVIEQRFPVQVNEFGIRSGSGGAGMHRGGDGVRRRLKFLKPLELSVLSQRRGEFAPYGLQGGSPGAVGRNILLKANGQQIDLGAQAHIEVNAGDELLVETPGGGAWGASQTVRN